MAVKDTTRIVEIFFMENDFIAFNFKEFAVVMHYNVRQGRNDIYMYTGNNYEKRFVYEWFFRMSSMVEEVKMHIKDINHIKKVSLKFSQTRANIDYLKLVFLLKGHFVKQVELYGLNV